MGIKKNTKPPSVHIANFMIPLFLILYIIIQKHVAGFRLLGMMSNFIWCIANDLSWGHFCANEGGLLLLSALAALYIMTCCGWILSTAIVVWVFISFNRHWLSKFRKRLARNFKITERRAHGTESHKLGKTITGLFKKARISFRSAIARFLLIARSGDVHPNPGPTTVTHRAPDSPLTFYSCNANSMVHAFRRIGILATLEHLRKPDIVAIQETKLDERVLDTELPFGGYTVFRKDRAYGAGGILIAVKSSLKAAVITQLSREGCELLWLEVTGLAGHGKVIVGNYYRPNLADVDSAHTFSEVATAARMYADRKNAKIVILGDFNCPDIDWSTGTCTYRGSRAIHDALCDAQLSQLVTFPTRGVNTLDLVCVSHPDLVGRLRTVPPIHSDHDGLAFCFLSKVKSTQDPPRPSYNWRRADLEKMSEFLVAFEQEYSCIAPHRSVEQNWQHMKSTFARAMSDNIPTSVKKNRSRPIPREVIRLCRQRDRAYRALREYPTHENRRRYNSLRNRSKRECARAHRTQLNRIADALGENNSQPFWRHVKSLRADQVTIPDISNGNGDLVSDPEAKANVFNRRFQSVFTAEPDGDIPYVAPHCPFRMDQFEITPEGVERRLAKLIITKASGPDEISAKFLQLFSPIIRGSVSALYQQSLDIGVLPADWKNASVHPIYKKGDRADPLNYRPVSLTSILCKQMEHIIVSQMNKYLSEHNLMYERQHGFRAGQSCETALASLTHDWAGTVDPSFVSIDCMLLDFAKAFDTVPHRRLLFKLELIGISLPVRNWIKDFLTARQQKVVISGKESGYLPVTSGIPQGSVLGPLLFSIYINDIDTGLSGGTTLNLFADDCIVYRPILGRADCAMLQDDLNILSRWSNRWLLKFNVAKCTHLRISLRAQENQVVDIPRYKLCGEDLPQSTSEKYLGVTLQSNLKFDKHIASLISRCNSMIGLMKRNLSQCSIQAKKIAYFALVRSRLEYCCVIFDPYARTLIRNLEAVQNRAVRFIRNDYSRFSHVSAMKEREGILPLIQRRKTCRHVLIRKYFMRTVRIPGVVIRPGGILFPPVERLETRNTFFYKTFREIHDADPRAIIPP